MSNPVRRFLVSGDAVAVLSWALALLASTSLTSCSIDDRPVVAAPANTGGSLSNGGQAGATFTCEGPTCVGLDTLGPLGSGCLAACPEDDACRNFVDLPASTSPDAGCISRADCRFAWKPAARGGEACRCDA